ncbi:MAG: helix-turn-helix domain-containing protein [Thermoleophilaceae bacterium]
MDRASLESFLAQGLSLEQIGKRVDRHPSTVGYWLKKHGLTATNHARHAPKGGLDRDLLEQLADSQLTLREIAEELEVSVRTVCYWLQRHGIERTATRERRQRRAGTLPAEAIRRCGRHGEVTFVLDSRGYYRCPHCRQDRVVAWRQRTKARLVNSAGGECAVCGYSRCARALHFHHLDPSLKEFGLAAKGGCRSFERLTAEAEKCVLLCSNCHAEVEDGVLELSHLAGQSSPS